MNKYVGLGLLLVFLLSLKFFTVGIASAITITAVLGVAVICDLLERKSFMNDLEKAYWLVFESGMSPYELAKHLGVSTTLIYRWQKNSDNLRRVQRKTLDKLVNLYDKVKEEA